MSINISIRKWVAIGWGGLGLVGEGIKLGMVEEGEAKFWYLGWKNVGIGYVGGGLEQETGFLALGKEAWIEG